MRQMGTLPGGAVHAKYVNGLDAFKRIAMKIFRETVIFAKFQY